MNHPAMATLILAMASFEGARGDRNFDNNNPCNLKFAHQPHATGSDPDGFAIFDTLLEGWTATERQILLDIARTPDLTLKGLIYQWAPPADNNPHDEAYEDTVAQALGAVPTARLRSLLGLI